MRGWRSISATFSSSPHNLTSGSAVRGTCWADAMRTRADRQAWAPRQERALRSVDSTIQLVSIQNAAAKGTLPAAPAVTTCDAGLAAGPWIFDALPPGYGPGASVMDVIPADRAAAGGLPEEYRQGVAGGAGSADSGGAADAGRAGGDSWALLPARRGDPVRRFCGGFISAGAGGEDASAAEAIVFLRRALHGGDGGHAVACRTRR